MSNFTQLEAGEGKHVKAWMTGVDFDANTIEQLKRAARLPVVYPYVAAMPDAHLGYGSTVGSVIPTRDAVIPAAVGVDIGCGMVYQPLDIHREDLPLDLGELRAALESAIPNGGPGLAGAWSEYVPARVRTVWSRDFDQHYQLLGHDFPDAVTNLAMRQLGTLGTGNHFVELVTSHETENVGIVLHSGSRGLGNKIGSFFTRAAKEYCNFWKLELPDPDLAFLSRGSEMFDAYLDAVEFAQAYAWENRLLILQAAYEIMVQFVGFAGIGRAPLIHCHHNYLAEEIHFGEKLFVTRKGAVRAALGDRGIIPGSMGARTYIVEGLGSEDSFTSCSHGAGRIMSRTAAKKAFTVEDHIKATEGVECDKTAGTIDETPGAYKDIEAVMAAQSDLVKPLYTVKQFLCVKGKSEDKKWQKQKQADAVATAPDPTGYSL
jgi:tRNA-splicing ligase RtcB (3'-phosphate/5'-hydroxy nucleic acid ligase)